MKKSIALITAVVIVLCFAFVYQNSYMPKKSLFTSSSAVLTENDERRFDGAETYDEIIYKYEDAIKSIKEGFENQSAPIDLSPYDITNTDLNIVITYLINSGYYYVNNSYSYQSNGKYVVSLTPDYLMNTSEVEKCNKEINAIIDEIAKEASSFKTNIEKLIYIHNYLVDNLEYAQEEDTTINNLYGALMLKKTMCVGYAQAFCRIAEKTGFKTYVVSSEKLNHAWNMVNLNGKYYFVDCTWDDPVFSDINLANDPVSGYGCYDYFMCSEAYFLKTEHNANDYIVNGENIKGVAMETGYDDFFWRNFDSLMQYSNGSWYHDYGYSSDAVYSPSDVKFSIDKFTFYDNANYEEETIRTIKAFWQYGNQYYLEFGPTMQKIDSFLYYFKPDGIYRLEQDGRFNGKDDLLIFENTSDENIYDFAIDTENGKFTVMYGKYYEYTDNNGTEKEYDIADYFCKVQEHQYILDPEKEGTEEKVYICTACGNTMKEIA